VVLDEATASLDFGNQGKAMRHANRVALLGDGKVLAVGPTDDVLNHAALAALYGSSVETLTALDGRVAFLPG
jgi:ABC-type cobalamin transport system ATPase subunit